MLSKRKKANGFKRNWKGLTVLATCFILIVSSTVAILIMQYVSESGIQTPDKLFRYKYGETCQSEWYDKEYSSIRFTDALLTDNLKGQSGQYIVFFADIQTKSHVFSSKDICLGFNMIKSPYYLFKNKTIFEKDLSLEISDTTLVIDKINGEMNGRIAFVFSIDSENYQLIKTQSLQTSFKNNVGGQIILHLGIYWCGGKSEFVFKTSEVQYVEKIN